ncbi:MAG: hypothetical protein U1E51_02820 [Candidatus Binatia bacterium]|nr:hypothetical protein [Candidatus Binatia bacterium]
MPEYRVSCCSAFLGVMLRKGDALTCERCGKGFKFEGHGVYVVPAPRVKPVRTTGGQGVTRGGQPVGSPT